MNCIYCGKELPDHVKFCHRCGRELPHCKKCGNVFKTPMKYCNKCGYPVESEARNAYPSGAAQQGVNTMNNPNNNNTNRNSNNNSYNNGNNSKSNNNSNLPMIMIIALLAALLGVGIFFVVQTLNNKNEKSDTAPVVEAPSQEQEDDETDDSIIEAEETAEEAVVTPLDTANLVAMKAESAVKEYDGHAYAIFNYKTLGLGESFTACEAYCESVGGHLATIGSEEENTFIYKLVKETGLTVALFGFTDQEREGEWKWVDGSPVTYTNWCRVKGKEQPNNGSKNDSKEAENYVEFFKDTANGAWNDCRFGVNTYRFVCEWE